MYETTEQLQALAGRELTAVTFVLDYLTFQFEDVFLTVLSDPSVTAAGRRVSVGMPGFRDMLCERISQTVTEVKAQRGKEIQLSFGDGSTMEIPLQHEERTGAEAVLLQTDNEELCVWHFE